MAIRPILIDKGSPFVGEVCALCKEPFSPGEEIIICPNDAARHHVYCWRANRNHCAAFGCEGHGAPVRRTPPLAEDDEESIEGVVVSGTTQAPASKVRTLPSSSLGCAQSCLLVAIALAIIALAVSCFGLWAMLDYLFINVLGWDYRQPLSVLATQLPALLTPVFLVVSSTLA